MLQRKADVKHSRAAASERTQTRKIRVCKEDFYSADEKEANKRRRADINRWFSKSFLFFFMLRKLIHSLDYQLHPNELLTIQLIFRHLCDSEEEFSFHHIVPVRRRIPWNMSASCPPLVLVCLPRPFILCPTVTSLARVVVSPPPGLSPPFCK